MPRDCTTDLVRHGDSELPRFTTKHIYFWGPRKKFQVRYNEIMDLEPFRDGFRIIRDAKNTKVLSFRIGDGWFAFNLAVNPAQI